MRGKRTRRPGEGVAAPCRSLALGLALAASCGGGGGGGSAGPTASAAFAPEGTVAPETGGAAQLAVVLSSPGGPLEEERAFAVVDSALGTATAGADYEVLDHVLVTFPAGSADGDVRLVTWTPLDDGDAEGGERVLVDLVDLEAGAVVSAAELLILDDESSSLLVTAGARGAAALAGGASVELGQRAVESSGAAAVEVWLENIGDSPVRVSAPTLTGAAGQFELELAAEPFASAATAAGPATLPFPLVPPAGAAARAAGSTRVALELSPDLLQDLAALASVELVGVPVPGGAPLDLALERVAPPVAQGAALSVDGRPRRGGLAAAVQDLSLWSGHVAGAPGASAFFAFSPSGSRGFAELEEQGAALHLLADATSGERGVLALSEPWEAPPTCAGSPEIPGRPSTLYAAAMGALERHAPYTCRLAIETDYQLYERFGDAAALASYVVELVAAVSARFAADVGVSFQIVHLGVWTTPADPWESPDDYGTPSDLLYELQRAWAPGLGGAWPVEADLAHFLSGAPLGGGVAWVNALCDDDFGFGVSTGLTGAIDWGAFDGGSSAFHWDFDVVAHELAHGFDARHTHEYCPPLDMCAPSCQGQACGRGTIMSYCHACAGGVANVDLAFHPVVANQMRLAANRSCLAEDVLLPGEARGFRVLFHPTGAPGPREALLELAHDALEPPSPLAVRVRGTAREAEPPSSLPLGADL